MSDQLSLRGKVSEAEWEVRVNLAAAYRLIDYFGMTDMIFTHVTARVPGPEHHILINRYGHFFEEVTASSLVKCDLDGNVVQDEAVEAGLQDMVNPIGFGFHSSVHEARPDVGSVIHTHTPAGIAVSSLDCGLLPSNQTALRFMDRISYHDYEGVLPDKGELKRMTAALGQNPALILHNHGLLTCGRHVQEAFHLMYYLEEACQLQLDILQTGQKIHPIDPDVMQQAARFFRESKYVPGEREWPALLRMLDRIDPGYRE